MRAIGIALTGMALAVGGLLTLGVSDVAFAKSPKHAAQQTSKSCKGKNEALENGKCVVTSNENPDHVPLDATQEPFYRSTATDHHHKKRTHSHSHSAPVAAAAGDANAPNPGSNAPTRRTLARDRTANPGRGDPGKTPQNATTEPF